jgi:hypothetical protein
MEVRFPMAVLRCGLSETKENDCLCAKLSQKRRCVEPRSNMGHKSRSGERWFIVKRVLQQFIEQGRIKRDGQIKNLRQGIAGGFGG